MQFVAAIPFIGEAIAGIGTAAGLGGTAAAGASAAPFAFGSGGYFGMGPFMPAAGAAATGGSMLSTILQGGATALSVLQMNRAGNDQSSAYLAAASDAETEAVQSEIAGQNREFGLKKQLSTTLGSIRTAYAANGIDLAYGAAQQTSDQAMGDADRELSLDRATTNMDKARLNERGANYRRMAASARGESVLKSAGSILSFGADTAKRFG